MSVARICFRKKKRHVTKNKAYFNTDDGILDRLGSNIKFSAAALYCHLKAFQILSNT